MKSPSRAKGSRVHVKFIESVSSKLWQRRQLHSTLASPPSPLNVIIGPTARKRVFLTSEQPFLSFQRHWRWRTAALFYGLTVNLIYICCKHDFLNLNRTFQFGMQKEPSALPQSFPIDVFYCINLCFCLCCCFFPQKCDFVFMTVFFLGIFWACDIPKSYQFNDSSH